MTLGLAYPVEQALYERYTAGDKVEVTDADLRHFQHDKALCKQPLVTRTNLRVYKQAFIICCTARRCVAEMAVTSHHVESNPGTAASAKICRTVVYLALASQVLVILLIVTSNNKY